MAKQKQQPTPAAPDAPKGRYTVLARRYRPQQFVDCIGQEHVSQALQNAITGDRVAHAYLFTGARGVGKTSMARIFAKALNCSDGPTTTPCGSCDICQSIAVGEDVDVIEIDGASNRGIEEVRELRQGVNYRPSRGRYKIYIIDEVHMLTKEAFNALLKTLEEPPGHVKFFFATTEPQKIPITILSRCQRFDFCGIDLPRILTRLKEIVESEGMAADEEALEIVARRAGGSMRDSQSLLDQLLAFGSERLTAEEVHRLLGTAGEDRIIETARAVFAGDCAACLQLVESSVSGGLQLGEWVEQMLDYFRDLMVLGISPQAPLVSMPNRLRGEMAQQAKGLSPERLLEMMDLLAACRGRMKSSTYGRTLLEMTLVRLCRIDQFLNLAVASENGLPGGASVPSSAAPTNVAPPRATDPGQGPRSAPQKKNDLADQVATSAPSAAPVNHSPRPAPGPQAPAANSQASVPTLEPTSSNVDQFWRVAREQVGDIMIVGMFDQAERMEFCEPSTFVAHFTKKTPKLYCEDPSRQSKLEQAFERVAGRRIAVRLEFSASQQEQPATRVNNQGRLMEMAAKNPLVRKAEELLGAKIRFVDAIVPKQSVSTPAPTGEADQDMEKLES